MTHKQWSAFSSLFSSPLLYPSLRLRCLALLSYICKLTCAFVNCQTSLTMYPNQMPQPPPQGSPMARPHTMMNAAPMPQPNAAMGMPGMRPMVASSPMQAGMLQQPGQPPMMARGVAGSPYGVVNRPPMFDKNKRSVYSNDLRQPPMVQPGQPPQMTYGAPMAPHPSMMPNAGAPPMAAPMRQ